MRTHCGDICLHLEFRNKLIYLDFSWEAGTWHPICLVKSEADAFLIRFRSLTSSVVIHPALRGFFCHVPPA
jgi:hypothetical protein